MLKSAGVEFKNGRPDFSPWQLESIKFRPGVLDGSSADFDQVYTKIRDKFDFLSSKTAAKEWLREMGLTPHHFDGVTIQLIPTGLHANVPHIGSASDLRAISGK